MSLVYDRIEDARDELKLATWEMKPESAEYGAAQSIILDIEELLEQLEEKQ